MSIYRIKDQVPAEELDKLVTFLKIAWDENHSLVKSKELLDFQHYDQVNNAYNFIVAENQITGEYDALVGYIPTSQFDKSLKENGDYWGAIWKRRDDVENEEIDLIGSDVFQRIFSLPYFHTECGISLSAYAVKACKAMRYRFGFMHQYYIINKTMKIFRIAENVSEDKIVDTSVSKQVGWSVNYIELKDINTSELKPTYKPYKSLRFLINRYHNHPIYHYDFLGLYENDIIRAILVVRKIEVGGAKVLRIVDVYGELGGYIYPSIQNLLSREDFEYVDFLNYGIPANIFKEMGFQELDFDHDKIVLPNYYEPFERRNVKMTIVHKGTYEDYVAFKGDSDQDRPSIV